MELSNFFLIGKMNRTEGNLLTSFADDILGVFILKLMIIMNVTYFANVWDAEETKKK